MCGREVFYLKLKTGSFEGMANDIVQMNGKIIIFGVGVIGSTITPEILKNYNLENRILCCIDNDRTRWNTTIQMCGRDIDIYSPDVLTKLCGNIVILITISRYNSAYEQLQNMEGTEGYSCYIIPALCIQNFHTYGGKGVVKTTDKQLIPKKIHYMWLGGKEIPIALQKCMESWKKYCPDYEIIRWDETNYDVHKNLFVSQAYDNHKYGFVPDYARIEILYKYGGIYLDTDVELKRNIDDLLYQEAFCGVEKWQVLNFGGCSGSVKGHKTLKLFLDKWEKRSLIRNDGSMDNISSGLIDTSVAISAGYKINGKIQTIKGLNIYSYDFFHPYDYMSGKMEMTEDTFSIHQFHGGWLDEIAKTDNLRSIEKYEMLMKSAQDVG